MYSACVVDVATVFCLWDDHDMGPPASVNTHPGCGKTGHTEEHCWVKNPEKIPRSLKEKFTNTTNRVDLYWAKLWCKGTV